MSAKQATTAKHEATGHDHIVTDRVGAVISITMSRPEKKNALTHAMYNAMADALENAAGDASIRVIL